MIFELTEEQATALILAVNALEEVAVQQFGARPSCGNAKDTNLATAANELDEQMANQNAKWEKCENCNGSGWVEDE